MKRTAVTRPFDIKALFLHHKKKVLIAMVALLVVSLFIGYIFWSTLSWQHVGNTAINARHAIKADIAQLSAQKTTARELADSVDDAEAKSKTACTTSVLIKWQSRVFGGAKDALDHCEKSRQQMHEAHTALEAIAQRVASEQQMAQKLRSLQSTLSQLAKDDYETMRGTWSTFLAEIEHDSLHSSLDSTKQAARDAAQDIVVGYDKLVAAHKAEKRADFDAAVADIEKGYSKLGAIQNSSVDSYAMLLDTLQDAAHALQ